MSRGVSTVKSTATSGALSLTWTAPAGGMLVGFTCKFNTAPTTANALTVTLDAVNGATYDCVLLSTTPSVTSATSVSWWPDAPIRLTEGDKIVVAFANADNRTYGAQLYVDAQPMA